MTVWDDPARVYDGYAIADEDLINIGVWAKLQGITMATAYSNLSKARKRRKDGQERDGDMPEPGPASLWTMGAYRAWEAARPGKRGRSGAGSRSGRGDGKRLRLPITCPNCQHVITAEELEAAQRALRAEFARLREQEGLSAAAAGERVGIGADTAKSWEMARRSAGETVAAGPLTVEMPGGRRRAIRA